MQFPTVAQTQVRLKNIFHFAADRIFFFIQIGWVLRLLDIPSEQVKSKTGAKLCDSNVMQLHKRPKFG